MNKAMLSVGIIFLSIMALVLINVISSYQSGTDVDYYLVKDVANAAIEDAIDATYYTATGLYRMDKEKFVESFLLRFADNVSLNNRNYTIGFYGLSEVPPAVSIKVNSNTVLSFNGEQMDIETTYSAIGEASNTKDTYVSSRLADPEDEFGKPYCNQEQFKENDPLCKKK